MAICWFYEAPEEGVVPTLVPEALYVVDMPEVPMAGDVVAFGDEHGTQARLLVLARQFLVQDVEKGEPKGPNLPAATVNVNVYVQVGEPI